MRFTTLFLLLGIPLLAQAQMQEAEKPNLLKPEVEAQLVALGARVGKIEIVAENVFDPSEPGEDKRLYRLANRIHVPTNESVLTNVLLFKTGDPFDPEALVESERLIRERGGIADAAIVPSAFHEDTNTVDILVISRDSWSLSTNIGFGRSGGNNDFSFGFEEKNLLGTGRRLEVLHESNVDRDRNVLGFTDLNLLGSRVRLAAASASASDGSTNNLVLGRPFYSLNTRWSIDTELLQDQRIDPIYDLGELVDAFDHETRSGTIQGGWSKGLIDGSVRRWLVGVTTDRHTFLPTTDLTTTDAIATTLLPEDRDLVYPWFGMQFVHDDFHQFVELNDMGRIEDVQLGLSLTAKLGYASERIGADRNAWVLDFSAQKGWHPSDNQLVTMGWSASTRREALGFTNSVFSTNATYYRKMFDRQMFIASFDAMDSSGLDLDQQILLGGDSGLRGYPQRYQSGTGRALLTLEQRRFTDWYPLKLVHVALAGFIDAGKTWGNDPRATPGQGMLYDIGFGLRLSSPRSSSGSVVNLDFAAPLNGDPSLRGLQINVRTQGSF